MAFTKTLFDKSNTPRAQVKSFRDATGEIRHSVTEYRSGTMPDEITYFADRKAATAYGHEVMSRWGLI